MSFVPRARRRRDSAAVLIVDDNAAVRGCLEAMFTALGYRADLAADGQEALPKLADGNYAAVICDLYMPHMDGDQLYTACRKQHREMADRFIFITGEVLDTLSCAASAVSGQPQLLKPFRLADIQAALSQVAAAS